MKDDYQPNRNNSPVLKWIIFGTIGVFVLQHVFVLWFGSGFLMDYFVLSASNLRHGMVWGLVTYAFLHGNVLHILVNMLLVYFMGRELLPLLGPKRFVGFYLSAAAAGGLVWLLVDLVTPSGALIGASASALGLLTVFACFYPNKPITILLFFIIPITIRPKHAVYAILAFSLFGLLFLELPAVPTDRIAHSAHLRGILSGWLFFRFVHARSQRAEAGRPDVEPPSWFRKKQISKGKGGFSVNITNRKALKKEVDRILDKINSEGFGSLSEEEKKVLDRARDLLNK